MELVQTHSLLPDPDAVGHPRQHQLACHFGYSLLRCDVMQGLGERPAMSGVVADGALTLSVREIAWLADDSPPGWRTLSHRTATSSTRSITDCEDSSPVGADRP